MNIKIWSLTAICFVIIFFINKKIQEPLSIENYLLNTYLYIALAIALVGTSWLCMSEYNISQYNPFILLMISIASLFTVLFTTNDQLVLKHIAWTTLVLTLAMASHIFFKINLKNDNLIKIFLMLIGIVCTFTYISFVMGPNAFLNLTIPLTLILCMVVVTEVVNAFLFAKNPEDLLLYNNLWNWFIIALFCGFLLIDTQKIITNGIIINNTCLSKNQIRCADYPSESLGVFLDIVNLFQRVSLINN